MSGGARSGGDFAGQRERRPLVARQPCATSSAVTPPSPRRTCWPRDAPRAHSAEIAILAGVRLVTAAETEEGRGWDDGRLKLLTGDPVTARRPGRDPFTFTPRLKLIVTGNHLPQLRGVDAALRRRLCVVPFAHRPAVPDRWLETRLRAEGPAILRWMIEGCLAWQGRGQVEGRGEWRGESELEAPGVGSSDGLAGGLSGGLAGGLSGGLAGGLHPDGLAGGLRRPAAVATATDSYLAGQDLVGQFLAERCDRDPAGVETAGALYAAWCAFANANGEPPGTQRRLATRLECAGLVREHLHHARGYRGVRLVRVGSEGEANMTQRHCGEE